MTNILLVGAGYVGMALLGQLQSKLFETTITTTSQERVEELQKYGKHVLLLKPDGADELEKYIKESDVIIVLVAPKANLSYEETYLNTAKRITAALQDRQKPLYLLYTSSTSVCDGDEGELITETTPLNPLTENAKILFATEQIYLNSEVNACILRLGGIYGPKREFIDRARRFSGVAMSGNPDKPTNSIHQEDIVSAILFCIEKSLTGIFQLVNDDHPSRRDLYDSLCDSLNLTKPLWNSKHPHDEDKGYVISNQKIKQAGFVFKHANIH